ncbi:MAG: hypothetical protein WDZ30_12920 [Cellvibrionaceae bacterium]
MKIVYLALFATLLVSACASQPAYKPANGSGYGYKESELGENRYRVQFKARGESRDKAMDYALLRSAELTILKGYDWFVIVDRETVMDREQSTMETGMRQERIVTRDCGLLNCTTRSHTVPSYSVGASTGPRSETETILEIRMGKGVRPSTGDSYDALETRDSLQSRTGV